MITYPFDEDTSFISYKVGIYYLYKNNKIVYIGSSKTIGFRIKRHKVGKNKKFDSFSYKECDESILLEQEAKEIYKYLPINNTALPTCKFNSNEDFRKNKLLKYGA